MSQVHRVSAEIGGKQIIIETGKLAKQATGSVTVRCGDSIVLVTAVASGKPKEGIDFLPLTVDYIEKTFAAGKIPGGFFKREGRPNEKETLTSRFIDRPIRPLFPEHYRHETQVIATVLSVDMENDPDLLAMIGASAALMISGIPFLGPIAGARIGRVNGQWVLNTSPEQMLDSDIDVIVAGSKDAVVMVEGGSSEVSEQEMIEAINRAHEAMQPIILAQHELVKLAGKTRWEVIPPPVDQALVDKVNSMGKELMKSAIRIAEKQKRYEALSKIKDELLTALVPADADDADLKSKKIAGLYEDLKSQVMRHMILDDGIRIDGRDVETIRPISCEVGLLPRTHGSALFTRGETQGLVVVTLGTDDDVQTIDNLMEEGEKSFMLHYNFPPFSVGEVKFLRSPGRREIGHGALAERAVKQVMPSLVDFPYTVRVVSEILESNGSSSMASVCGASLALMDAGVPILRPVAGIAMGLIKEEDRVAILSDILGDEDHLGDMDFKVTGTEKGITAIQMDIKIEGLSKEVLSKALEQARRGRLHIIGKMNESIGVHRGDLSQFAPRLETIRIPKEKIKDVIGPQGKIIKGIVELTGVKIDINDDGNVNIFSNNPVALKQAKDIVVYLTARPEEGKVYLGKVVKIMDFGAFVEILPGTDGLVHISQLSNQRVNQVTDVVKEGDEVVVKVLEIGKDGKIRLSLKEAEGLTADVKAVKFRV